MNLDLDSMPHQFLKWRDSLLAACDEQSVRNVVRDYLTTVTPEMLAQMTEENRRALLYRPIDIQGTAVTLLHEEMRFQGDSEVAAMLHEVAHTFAAASVRLSQLKIEPVAPTASRRDEAG